MPATAHESASSREAPDEARTIRVFLCDDVADFRALMRVAFEDEPRFQVVGEAADGLEGVDGVARTQPDVVLLDIDMPRLDGLEAIPQIRRLSPGTAIVALSGMAAERMEEPALTRGAARYVEKGGSLRDLRRAVREVAGAAA